jgi:lipopolysaccharide/colanic/teichoic acid biosynthesis glycosyltransferase
MYIVVSLLIVLLVVFLNSSITSIIHRSMYIVVSLLVVFLIAVFLIVVFLIVVLYIDQCI